MSQMLPPTLPNEAHSREPVVGVIYNPHSHRNRGLDLEIAERPNVFIAQPKLREDITATLAEFAERKIDYLIINGGDGTVRDILTCAHAVFDDDWPELAVLPKGKTNALNVDLGAPADWTLAEAIDAFGSGQRIKRRPLSVTQIDQPGSEPMLGFIIGGGAFTRGVQAGQDAHKLGAFNSLAVAATSAWGVAQGLFGSDSNIWRRGTPVRFLLGKDLKELTYASEGDTSMRSVFLGSTLERFPAGMKLFNTAHTGLKLSVMDRPRRRVLFMLPLAIAGYVPQWVRDAGFQQVSTDQFDMIIGEEFILDGEAYPAGHYRVASGPELSFVVP